jgi:hypothetical protein
MANTAVVYRLDDFKQGLKVAGLFGGVLALGQVGNNEAWAQIAEVPVPGNPAKKALIQGTKPVICQFGKWKSLYPDTKVLAPIKEFDFYYAAYDRKPKGFNSDPLMNETVVNRDMRLTSGDEVFGIAYKGQAKAYLLTSLKTKGQVEDTISGQKVKIVWSKQLDTPIIQEPFPGFAMRSYWYAWMEFYPKTGLQK